MPTVKTTAILPSLSGDPKDTAMFSFVFQRSAAEDPATPTDAHHCNGYMAKFLIAHVAGGLGGGSHSVSSMLANRVDRAAHFIESFDVIHGGSALATDTPPGGLEAALAGGDLATQLALVFSFRGDYGELPEITPEPPTGPKGDAHPRARVRGRVFLGPLNNIVAGAGNPSRPSVPAASTIYLASQAMADQIHTEDLGWRWVVWSKVNNSAVPVTNVKVDDRWDVQRRRAVAVANRYTWTLT